MKTYQIMKKITLSLVALVAMTASAQTSIVTFEAAQLAADGTLQGSNYEENGFVFENYNDPAQWYNAGFTVSNNTDRNTASFMNQYSVDARGGAGGSKNFVIYNPCYYQDCYIRRADNADFTPQEVAVALTAYTSISIQDGDAFSKKFGKGDFYRMHIKGLDAEGNVLKAIDTDLISYPNAWLPWATIDLSTLGTVNKIFIDISSSDSSEWEGTVYVNTPCYLALDNFTVADTPTEIKAIGKETTTGSKAAYNLAGQRISKQYKGVIISNGKKILN